MYLHHLWVNVVEGKSNLVRLHCSQFVSAELKCINAFD